ncbi:type II secretion system minor pseudopilin GspJ [Thiomicrorhabdus sp.]|uniref:type II secretion system minor pseudopilin GspJ n=1 Tax=Thiomicrorhabdus sp. TaxID=2039724 RepID=UPI0035632E92
MNSTVNDSTSRQAGFTLIELLIALTISAVIAVLAYQTVSSVVTVQERTEDHAAKMEQLQRAIWWMEQDFIQLAPRTIQDGLGGVLPAFQYRRDLGVELTRIAEFPTPYGMGGLLRVAYRLEDGVLYRLVWPVLDRAPDTQPTKLPVLDHVERFEIRLLNANNEYVRSWPSEQQTLTALPRLTEVSLEIDGMGEMTRLFMGADAEISAAGATATQTTDNNEANDQ